VSRVLGSISLPVSNNFKQFRLGGSRSRKPRPLKMIFPTKDEAANLLRLRSTYLPPLSPLPIVESQLSCVEHILTTLKPNTIILCGDYNIPQVSWSSDYLGLTASGCSSPLSTAIADSFSFLNFFQNNYCFNSSGDALDLVFFLILTKRQSVELQLHKHYPLYLRHLSVPSTSVLSIPSSSMDR